MLRQEEMPVLKLKYLLTKEETYKVLIRVSKRPGKVRMAVQSAVLAALSVYCFAGFVLSGNTTLTPNKDYQSLAIAIAALVILALMWVFPIVYFRIEAANMYKNASPIVMNAYPDRLLFGGSKPMEYENDRYSYTLYGDMIILNLPGEFIAVPYRVLDGKKMAEFKMLLNEKDQQEKSERIGTTD